MPRRTASHIKLPWNGGINTIVDPGVLNDNDLVLADNVEFTTSGSRLKREGISNIERPTPEPDFRSSSGTSRTLIFTSDQLVDVTALDGLLVQYEHITVISEGSGNDLLYEVIDVEIDSVTSVAEVTDVVTVADSGGSLNNKYFFINAGAFGTHYYVWFNVNAAGTDPALSGRTGLQVALATGATANTVASAIQAVVNPQTDFNASVVTNTVTITNTTAGPATDATAETSGFTVTVTTQGSDQITYTAATSLSESSTATTTLLVARSSAVINIIDYWRLDSNNLKAQLLLSATEDFQLFRYDVNNTRTEILGQPETTTILATAASTLTAGGVGDYFTINSSNDETHYYVWLDVDNGDSDPAPATLTGIEVDVTAADTAAQVATKIKNVLDAHADFIATVSTATVTVTTVRPGITTNAADVTTPFTITTTINGATTPDEAVDKITSIVMQDIAIFAFTGIGNLPIRYRLESSPFYQLLGGSPPDFSIMTEHLGRLWTNDKNNPDRLHYSSTFNPEEWNGAGDSGAIDVDPGDGDNRGITGIYSFKGILFISKGRRFLRLTGFTPEDFTIEPVSRGIGIESHQAICPVDENDVIFISKRGIHSTVTTDQYGDTSSQFLSTKIQNNYNDFQQDRLEFVQSAYIPELNSVFFSISENDSNPDDIWLYNTLLKEWCRWPEISCTALATRLVDGTTKLMIGMADGVVAQAQNGTFTDFETDGIFYLIQTGSIYPGGNPETIKGFKQLRLLYKALGSFQFTVTLTIDNYPPQVMVFSQESGGDRLGIDFVLGSSVLGETSVLAPFTKSIEGHGRGCTIRIEQSGTEQQVEIFGYIIEWEEEDIRKEVI